MMDTMTTRRVLFADHAHQNMVRNLIDWPEFKLRKSLLNPGTVESILAERSRWLATDDGREVAELCRRFWELVRKP